MNPLRLLWRVLRALLLLIAALWLFFEEWGWHPLAAWLARFARWPPWARLEASIASTPPRLALLLFMIPAIALLPVKLLALWLLQGGHPGLGLAVIIAAKLLGTAVGGRLFMLTRRQLMQMRRFARAVAWVRWMRRRVRHALRRATPLRYLRRLMHRVRVWVRGSRL